MAKTTLNLRGMLCPMPIMKVATEIKKAASGDTFEVICDDKAFEPDIVAWCNETGNTLNSVTKSGSDIIATITKK